jgi:hypothetical protein
MCQKGRAWSPASSLQREISYLVSLEQFETAFRPLQFLVVSFQVCEGQLEVNSMLLAYFTLKAFVIEPQTDPSKVRHVISVLDCWGALNAALNLGWLVDPASDAEVFHGTGEFGHYANPANGNVHMLALGSLYLFATPDVIPDGQAWVNTY